MKLYSTILSAALAMTAATASAQTTAQMEPALANKQATYRIGLHNLKNLNDKGMQQIGKFAGANGRPTIATATKSIKAAANGRFVTARNKANANRQNVAGYTASDTLFWDSFENWDGQTLPFVPTEPNKWETKSNIADLTPYLTNGICPTWTTYKGDGYNVPYATDKHHTLVCMFGGEAYSSDGQSVIAPAPQQDEWAVSPTIQNIEKSTYLTFDINYAPYDMHFFVDGDTLVDFDRKTFDVEVLVTTKTRSASFNEEDYACIYKLSDTVDDIIAHTDMEDDQQVSQLLYMRWERMHISLADYDGQNIRIALRYKGSKGGSVLIDAIRVSDLLPVAQYDIPEGTFYWAFSDEMYTMTNASNPYKFAYVPAYTDTYWANLSNTDSESFGWSYILGNDTVKTNDFALKMPSAAPQVLVEMPRLKATAGARTNEYMPGFYQAGLRPQYTYDNGQTVDYNVGNFDLTKDYFYGESGMAYGSKVYVFGTNSGAIWSNFRYWDNNKQEYKNYDRADGIANYFDAPASPYIFDMISLPLCDYLNFGANIVCTVYRANGSDATAADEVLAEKILNANDAVPQAANGIYVMQFKFDEPIVVDDAIFVVISGFSNTNLIEMGPMMQYLSHDNGEGYALVKLRTQDGTFIYTEVANALSAPVDGGNWFTSFCIEMNAVFPYLHSNDGDVFLAANTGEVKTFDITTYWNPKDWQISLSESWIHAEPVVDEEEHKVVLKVTADALPEAVKGREAYISVSAPCCEQIITVAQGDAITGINTIKSNPASVNGTYTLSGQRINSANLAKGIYIQNGKKIIK